MPLNWNEIKTRAVAFSKEWENTHREEADAKEFLIEFLNVFGITRRRVATFEHKVKKLNSADGYIDLLWSGMLLVEMKSRGKDLEKAYIQAKEYCHGLKEYELPKLIIVSDFHHFDVYNEEGEKSSFILPDLIQHIILFAPLAGYQKRIYKEQDPVNIQAAERMGKLHDKLKAIGYDGHNLELYLVRLLFCLFADDTGIFEKGIFLEWIEDKTKEDGSDLAANISQFFQVLNTPEEKRLSVLDDALTAFPYINGKLFEENLPIAAFDSQMRKQLLDCCALDWGKISPAIFGSLFQSVMDEKARRNLGAHYTSEKNILKLIKPLFLDEFKSDFEAVKNDKPKLKKLHDKISKLRFLDPACGCGNFLVVAYRELRLLELEIVEAILKGQQVTSINDYFLIDVDQFYGIEYEEFPSQIAQVAMWLMDHQLNGLASLKFGQYYKRIPLKKSATLIHGNALRIDWQSLINPMPWEKHKPRFHYVLGNPPFLGKQYQDETQKEDLELVFEGLHGSGVLDYVTAWYLRSAQYMTIVNKLEDIDLPKTKTAFVSTNSISQGEQVAILWNELFNKFQIKIHFAHRTFKWTNEAKGKAAVHCVIIGFANFDSNGKLIYEYNNPGDEAHEIKAKNINPYLVEGKDNFIPTRKKPICQVPEITYGSMANDGGNLLLSDDEKNKILSVEPEAIKVIRPFLGSQEFINNIKRWCIWLKDVPPNEYSKLKEILNRIEKVKSYRLESNRPNTKKLADFPMLFGEIRQPKSNYLLIPGVSSENRKYIPIGFLSKEIIASDLARTIADASLYLFGVVTSEMHMTWVKYVCGRLKSDFRYSNSLVYNNFPWPLDLTNKQKENVEKAAQAVLETRIKFPESSLADLYGSSTMPPELLKAHRVLDKAVDLCYRSQSFLSEDKRIEFLFELYDKYTAGLFVINKKGSKKKDNTK